MSAISEGLGFLTDPTAIIALLVGLGIGTLVGLFPGITGTMAVALASSFTLTLEPAQGLAVLLSIYVGANFGDRIPAILVNTPGTPAAISTTFDGYPMAKQGKAGLALTISGITVGAGILVSMIVFIVAARPIAQIALKFGPAEMFSLVVFGLTVMVSVSSKSVLKGLLAGLLGLAIATVGRDPITGDERFVFGINDLNSGIPFIAVIIGLFGVSELLDQIITHHESKMKPISGLGRWWPNRSEYKQSAKPFGIGAAVGTFVGIVPAAGGDIAGIVGWDQARRVSKEPEKFGKGSVEGVASADAASGATLGGALTTTMALGIPGDSVMAVMIGSMVIWGLQPGPSLFVNRPDLIVTIAAIMLIATFVTLAVSLMRMKSMVKLLDLKNHYLWAAILIFCVIGTYTTTNSLYSVWVMLIAGFVGVILKRGGFPPGPIVLGLLLGPLAEANLRRALVIGGPTSLLSHPISVAFLLLAVLSLAAPFISKWRKARKARSAATSM